MTTQLTFTIRYTSTGGRRIANRSVTMTAFAGDPKDGAVEVRFEPPFNAAALTSRIPAQKIINECIRKALDMVARQLGVSVGTLSGMQVTGNADTIVVTSL